MENAQTAVQASKVEPSHNVEKDATVVGNRTVYFILLSNFLATLYSAFLGPFYPVYATKNYDASETKIGIFFGLHPIGALVATPIVTRICASKFGRSIKGKLVVWHVGVLILAASSITFGYGTSMGVHMLSYFFQGVSSAVLGVSGLMIITSASSDVTKDVGMLESLIGVSEILGPVVGASMYTGLGLDRTFLVVGLLVASQIFGLYFVRRAKEKACEAVCPSEKEPELIKTKSWQEILCDPGFAACVIAIMTASGSWGFLETVLEAHLEMAFDLSVVQNGFMFSIIGISFSLVSAFIHRIINQVGRGNSMTIGLLLISLSFLILGPVPALKEMINTMNEAWASVIVPLVFIGAGTGLVLAPAFSFLSDVMPSEDNVLASGCFITSIELGEVLGPMTGGMAMDKLPQLADIFCLRPDLDCTCGFSWSCTTFSIVNLVIMFLVLGGSVLSARLESLRKEEQRSKDFENILSGRSSGSQDARIKELSEKFGDLPMNVQFTV